jgi:hypothetical protein
MRVYGQPFVKYNDFHVPFRGMDIINIEAMRAAPDLVKRRFSFGEGMNDVLRDDMAERIVNLTTPDGPSDEAPFKIDTIVMSEEGTSISGDDLHNLIEEARAQNVTIASLIHRLPNTRSQIIITPGPGVVEQRRGQDARKATITSEDDADRRLGRWRCCARVIPFNKARRRMLLRVRARDYFRTVDLVVWTIQHATGALR